MRSKKLAAGKLLLIFLQFLTPSPPLCASVAEGEHLLPVQDNFETPLPWANKSAKVREHLLFPARGWLIRYFEVIGDPPYDTGLTIYKTTDGSYFLMVKQIRPALGDLVMHAYYGDRDLRAAFASVKIETSNRRIPAELALEVYNLWISLLRNIRAQQRADGRAYIHPRKVILSAKERANVILSGKYPPNAAKLRTFAAVESLVDRLVKSCDATNTDRARLLRKATKDSRSLRIGPAERIE